MKYISITFDDGRKDNYTRAYPIMSHYNMTATVFVTTGFVDETWKKEESWLSAGEALSIDEIRLLKQAGWEVGVHGDKHITDIEDTKISIKKLNLWLGTNTRYGFSLPNSNADSEKMAEIEAECSVEGRLSYIRRGRGRNPRSIASKALFAIYSFLKLQWAYNRFNAPSINNLKAMDLKNIKSIVIRNNDNPVMIRRFIEQVPDNSIVVFMLHSILKEGDLLYNADPWCWDSKCFDQFCSDLSILANKGEVTVIPLERVKQYDQI